MTEYLTLDLESILNPLSEWEPTERMKQAPNFKEADVFPPPPAQRIISACSLHLKPIVGNPKAWEPLFVDYGPDLKDVPTEGPDQISEELEYEMVKRLNLYMANAAARGATLVTFNGRGFDIPLLYTRCMVFGINTSAWYTKDFRYRFSENSHIDLLDVTTEYGAVYKSRPNLSLLCKLFGLPGKYGIDGSKVKDFYASGRYKEIRDYCMSDNMETGIVFLRWMVSKGYITVAECRDTLFKIQDKACEKDEKGEALHEHMCKLFDLSDPNRLFMIKLK